MMNGRYIFPYLWLVHRSYLIFIGNDGILKFHNAIIVTTATGTGLFIFFNIVIKQWPGVSCYKITSVENWCALSNLEFEQITFLCLCFIFKL